MNNNNIGQNHSGELADLLFPSVKRSVEDIFSLYPKRLLKEGALVTRFGPSPTGFTHIGGIYTALLNKKLAIQSSGRFILRIEDTDRVREVPGGTGMIIDTLNAVSLSPDEGPIGKIAFEDVGDYGPYRQSSRKDIYHVFAKKLVADGFAYPCFLHQDELEKIREKQKEQKLRPGIYGEWSSYREASLETIQQKLDKNEPYVLRLKPLTGSEERRIQLNDLVRGELELPENSLDIVLIKSDGFPTYHFAHPIDDTLMGVNLIIRGDEWISTTPIHAQLFELLKFPKPNFAHIAPIAKMDGSSRRKLSKRKDDEASMSHYYEMGYEPTAIKEYLMNLLDSGFEDWRIANPTLSWEEFNLSLEGMGKSSSLFDWQKLNDIARDVMVKITAEQRYQKALCWAESYAPKFAATLAKDPQYANKVLNIGVHQEQPRKDLAHWSEIEQVYGYFFEDGFNQENVYKNFDEMKLANSDKLFALQYLSDNFESITQKGHDEYIANVREFAVENGFALKPKAFKKDPESFKGMWGEILMLLRVVLTGEKKTPDLYEVIQVMGSDRCQVRIKSAIDYFS